MDWGLVRSEAQKQSMTGLSEAEEHIGQKPIGTKATMLAPMESPWGNWAQWYGSDYKFDIHS